MLPLLVYLRHWAVSYIETMQKKPRMTLLTYPVSIVIGTIREESLVSSAVTMSDV